MGQEKETTLHLDGETFAGKALLETDELLFRGEKRVRIAFQSITKLEVARGRLKVTHAGGVAELELGALAATWADKIKNPKGRLDKLGIKQGADVVLIGTFDDALRPELDARSVSVATRPKKDHSLVLFAAGAKGDLARIPALRAALAPAGALWIVYPKGKQEIREADVLQAGRAAKMTDHKVARFSETHTALKFVIPPALRKA